jgi:CO/xanthine dehydrogenase FAD-binding subunit
VKPAAFTHFAPVRVDEALALLAQHGADAKVLAGGQSLVPAMNFRLGRFSVLVDLNRIADLAYIRTEAGRVHFGAMTRQRDIELSPIVREQVPLLLQATRRVSHLPIRSRGTVGGSCAHADPASEYPAVMLALGARFTIRSPAGTRQVAAADFFRGFFETAVEPGEILVEIDVPAALPGQRFAFDEVSRRKGDFAIVGIAAATTLRDGRIAEARLTGCGIGAGPVRLAAAERVLEGRVPTPALMREAAQCAAGSVEAQHDLHASADYRRRLVLTLVERVVAAAALPAEAHP